METNVTWSLFGADLYLPPDATSDISDGFAERLGNEKGRSVAGPLDLRSQF